MYKSKRGEMPVGRVARALKQLIIGVACMVAYVVASGYVSVPHLIKEEVLSLPIYK